MKFSWTFWKTLFLFAFVLSGSGRLWAHDDHDIPGALPPTPHGGAVQEATDFRDEGESGPKFETKQRDDQKGSAVKGEDLFFEAVYSKMKVTIYPLVILPNDSKSFVELSVLKNLTNIRVKIEIPRTKTMVDLVPKIESESVSVEFDAKKANRFIVYVFSVYQNKGKLAKIQIENY